MFDETAVESTEAFDEILLKDGIELLPEGELEKFLVDPNDQIHIDNYNDTFDQSLINGEHVIECRLKNATRWMQTVNFRERPVLMTRTEYDSGVVTRSLILPHHERALSTIARPDGSYAENHVLTKFEDKFIETTVSPLGIWDHFALRRFGHGLQQDIYSLSKS